MKAQHISSLAFEIRLVTIQKYWNLSIFYLHNALLVPHNGVGVESLSGIKPEIELLFSVAFPLGEHIGMENIWLSSCIPQKLKVNLIVGRPLRR
jgi:hypothetical protein